MKLAFKDNELENIFYDESYSSRRFHLEIRRGFIKACSYLEQAESERDLYMQTSLHYEKLKGNLEGKHSVRVNKQRRLIFTIDEYGNVKVISIEELTNHYQ